MPQYYLKGWIECFPGEGEHVFQLPPDSADATIDVSLHDENVGDQITFNTSFSPGTDADDGYISAPHVRIAWNSVSQEMIATDYLVTPHRIILPSYVDRPQPLG